MGLEGHSPAHGVDAEEFLIIMEEVEGRIISSLSSIPTLTLPYFLPQMDTPMAVMVDGKDVTFPSFFAMKAGESLPKGNKRDVEGWMMRGGMQWKPVLGSP